MFDWLVTCLARVQPHTSNLPASKTHTTHIAIVSSRMARRSSRKLAKARHEFLLAQERAREAKKAAKAERKRERISAAAEAVRKSSLAAAVHAAVHEHIAAAAKSASAASGSASSTSASKGKRKRSNSNAFESPLLSTLASQYPNA